MDDTVNGLNCNVSVPDLQRLAERMEGHISDLEHMGDEVIKVRELILQTLNSEGKRWADRNLGEATDRLEKRIRKWIQQLSNEYRMTRTEILRYGNDREPAAFPPRTVEAATDGRQTDEIPTERRSLTRREAEILRLVTEGKSSREIGKLLFISPHTVDRHRANIMAKLNVKKATDLVKYAMSQGMIVSADTGGHLAR